MEKVTEYIDLLAESGESFMIKTAGRNLLKYKPATIDGGAIMLCTAGKAVLKIDTESYPISEGSEAVLFDCVIMLEDCSDDFSLSLFIFSKKFKEQATRKFDPEFFGHLALYPVYRHPEGCYENTVCYFKLIEDIQADVRNRYRNVIAMNLLRSMLFNIHDKIRNQISFTGRIGEHTRKEELLNKFIKLLLEFGHRHREVAFYADKLCITPRYLSQVTESIINESPKRTIDKYVIREIKVLLTFSELSLQQIADEMRFPDQSYFGRYFKHFAKISPSEYRRRVIEM